MHQETTSRIAKRLKELNITLPIPANPAGNYVPYKIIDTVVYISGQIPIKQEGTQITGKLGKSLSIEEGQTAARHCGLNLLAWLQMACKGTLDTVTSINHIQVMVNATEDFADHPQIANGISDLLVEIFGKEIGGHTRVAFGASNLPFHAAVEVSGIFSIELT